VSAALLWKHRAQRPTYWKPIQTGIESDDDTATVRALGGYDADAVLDAGIRLERPLSPHRAAELAGTTIDLSEVTALPRHRGERSSVWIVEGAGGLLVPLNASALIADLIVDLAMPVVVVARSTLGTINHTLLTLEAARGRGLAVGGVVMVGPPDAANRAAIERYGRTRVVGEMPPFEPFGPDALRQWADASLDPYGCLNPLFE
jgi:dethiobiotin synthase